MPGAAPEQLASHVIVRAGAGAGKTRRLTHQVIDIARAFVAREKRFPRIVVTTFTRKATQELRERLMLKVLADDPDMIDFVNSRSHLVVSTIHGVLDMYLKRYGGQLGIDANYAVMGSNEADRMAKQVLRRVLLENEPLQPLLEMFGFNRLVKLSRRFHEMHLRAPDAKPHTAESMADLFRGEAENLAAELLEVASHVEAESTKEDWLAMARELKALAQRLRGGAWQENRDSLLAQIDLIKTARFSAKNPPVSDATNASSKRVLARVRALSDEIFDPESWREFAATFALFDELGRLFSVNFSATKIEHGSVEISDLELLAMECARRRPETAQAFNEEWDYWLIDEYQDTSPFQVELLRHLSGDRPAFIVGDPQQSIYLFRGARSEVFSEKEGEIIAGGGQRDFLQRNYRSKPELLLFFNDLFARLETPFQAMEPNLPEDGELQPARQVARFFIAADSDTSSDDGPDDGPDDGDTEMLALVRHVQDLFAGGAAPEDICVLARTNQTLNEVATWLDRYDLPTHVHAASGFYSRRETMDALALLKFLVNPHDNKNTTLLLRSPWFRVPDEQLTALILPTKTGSHWERICMGDTPEFEAALRLRNWLEQRSQLGITETFRLALIDSGFIDFSHFHDMSGRRESNVWKLLVKLAHDERQPGFNYLDFIANSETDLREASGAEESDAIATVEPARINLMTIHASKGLQFKHVILPKLGQAPRLTPFEDFTFDEDRNLWALRMPRGENQDMTASLAEKAWLEIFRRRELAEHARVLYVAMTRAIDDVFLSWSGQPARHSWADMLRWDLAEGLHAGASYTYVVQHAAEAPVLARERESTHAEPRTPWAPDVPLGADGIDRVRQNVSVTQILDRSAPASRKWEMLDIPQRLRLASQGTAVHRLMEALKSPTAESIRNLILRWFPGQEERVLAAVNFVIDASEPPLADIIRQGFVEWGFSFLEKGTMIEGQIDLWGRIESPAGEGATVWVIDYKTGNPEGRDKAFQQLALYALALRKGGEVHAGDRVRLAAVYPFAKKIFIEEEPAAEWYRERFPL